MPVLQAADRERPGRSVFMPVLLILGLLVSACGDGEDIRTYTVEEIRTRLETSGFVIDSSSSVEEVQQMTADEGYRWEIDGEPVEIYRYSPTRRAARRALDRARSQGLRQQLTVVLGNVAVIVEGHPDSVALRRALQQNPD